MEDLEFEIEGGGLWLEDGHSRCKDSIMPCQHLMHIFLFNLYRESMIRRITQL